jgi:tRNA(Ile)-lysidine synthase TilS/MesJ
METIVLGEVDKRAIDAVRGFTYKIDLFMRSNILPKFMPERIRWWLSLSGGKDSFAMAEGLRRWYMERGLKFNAVPFTLDQWHGEAPAAIRQQIPWNEVQIVEAYELTMQSTGYKAGQQAPCRLCSDVRRNLTDKLIQDALANCGHDATYVNVIARGLHLTDITISALWRYAMGKSPAEEMFEAGKGRPVTHLSASVHLAKPLYYAREFESQQFAQMAGYRASCCGCPACNFPSRRDIVEESIAGFLRSSLWEFDVPGVEELLTQSRPLDAVRTIKQRSELGIETKHRHLPVAFARATVKRYVERWNSVRPHLDPLLENVSDLDQVGIQRLRNRAGRARYRKLPKPSILKYTAIEQYSDFHLMTIATLGPFWGAIGLEADLTESAWEIQRRYFDVVVDERWSQVGKLLREYYSNHGAARSSQHDFVRIGDFAKN